MPTVTVVVPTHNRSAYVRDTVTTILAQSFRDFELLVVDNASTEDVAGALRHVDDSRLSILRFDTSLGFPGNLNRALGLGGGELIVAFHDDDTMHPSLLQAEVDLMRKRPDLTFAATGYAEVMDAKEMSTFEPDPFRGVEFYRGEADLALSFLRHGELCFPSVMYRRRSLGDHRMDEDRYGVGCDRIFLLDLARLGSSALIRGPWVKYRIHDAQVSRAQGTSEAEVLGQLVRYREALRGRWNRDVRSVFLMRSTNIILGQYARMLRHRRGPLRGYLLAAADAGLIHPLYIRREAVVALLKLAIGRFR